MAISPGPGACRQLRRTSQQEGVGDLGGDPNLWAGPMDDVVGDGQ